MKHVYSISKVGALVADLQGSIFLLASLFAGFCGGALGVLQLASGTPSYVALHGLLLNFYVIIPAFLGGIGRIALPAALNAGDKRFHWIDHVAFAVLMLGLACGMATIFGWTRGIGASLLLWSFGVAVLACNTLIFILETQTRAFKQLLPFVWSQLTASVAVILASPVTAILALKMTLFGQIAFKSILDVMTLPLEVMSVTAVIGLSGAAFWPEYGRLRGLIVANLLVLSVALPVIWFKTVMIGMLISQTFWTCAIAMPSLTIVAVLMKCLWTVSRRPTASLLWSAGAVTFLTAGWFCVWVGPRDASSHSWVLFAGISALFGAFYAWQETRTTLKIPAWQSSAHFMTYAIGVIFSLSPWYFLQGIGHVFMGFCLAFVVSLSTRLYARRHRNMIVASPLQEAR